MVFENKLLQKYPNAYITQNNCLHFNLDVITQSPKQSITHAQSFSSLFLHLFFLILSKNMI